MAQIALDFTAALYLIAISATAESDGLVTGLLFRLIPFVIGAGLAVSGGIALFRAWA